MKKIKGIKSTVITICIASVLIIGCTMMLGTRLASVEGTENTIKTDTIEDKLETVEINEELDTSDLNIIIDTEQYGEVVGEEILDNLVTPQYAMAKTTEVAERVFDQQISGRVYVTFSWNQLITDDFHVDNSYYWYVNAETTDGGVIYAWIDADTGMESSADYEQENLNENWVWFDNWYNEESVKQREDDYEETRENVKERLEMSDEELHLMLAQAMAETNDSFSDISELSDDELLEMLEQAKEDSTEENLMSPVYIDTVEANADSPYEETAINFINDNDIGYGSRAVSAVSFFDFDLDAGGKCYEGIVELDDGGCISVCVQEIDEAAQATGYSRNSVTYQEKLEDLGIAELVNK